MDKIVEKKQWKKPEIKTVEGNKRNLEAIIKRYEPSKKEWIKPVITTVSKEDNHDEKGGS